MHSIGVWSKGRYEPLWFVTSLAARQALRVYRDHVQIEEGFHDLKRLLGMNKLMNKRQDNLDEDARLAAPNLCLRLTGR